MTDVITKVIKENGNYPNNPILPVLHCKNVFKLKGKNNEEEIQDTFLSNAWYRPWVNSIYDFHHFHSNNHEALGIAKGTCKVILGGENGYVLELKKGDLLVLPAGISHKRLECSQDFTCVGAYSIDVDYDMNFGEKPITSELRKKIKSLPRPDSDPVHGAEGPVLKYWHTKS